MKGLQVIASIKNMVILFNYNIEIIPCPIIREENGLAKSSRNTLLDEEYKKNAPHIYATLKKARNLASQMNVSELKNGLLTKSTIIHTWKQSMSKLSTIPL